MCEMEGWKEVTLGKLGITYSGLSGKTKDDFGYGDQYIPYTNIYNNSKINIEHIEFVNIKPHEKQNEVKIGDLFFTTSSETIEEVGMSSVLLNDIGLAYLNSFCFGFRLFNFIDIIPEYAQFLFRSEHIRHKISMFGKGSTRYNLSKTLLLKNLNLEIPNSLDEQRKIAEILSTIDKAIEQTEVLIAKYKNIKKGLMHNLLTYGIDKDGNVRNPNTHTFVEKNGIVVPEEWEVRRVDELSNVTGGKRLPAGHDYSENRNGFKYLRVTDFYNKNIDYQNLENLEESTFKILERYEIFNKDLFISIAGSIGYVGVFKSAISDRIILTENALRINLFEVVLPEYLSFQINSEVVQKQIWSEIGTGGGVPKLAMHRVKSLLIPHPIINKEYNEQQKIIDVIDAKDKLIESEETNLAKLQKQKQGLMQDLLTGKVRVKI
jgi:restriction endonuclease S subunit